MPMLGDGFTMMMEKYFADAQNEIAESKRRRLFHKQHREQVARHQRLAKNCLLAVVLVGVGCGVYFAGDLGGLLATNMTNRRTPDPSLQAPPPSKAKYMRKMSEVRKQRDDDLGEIEKF